MNEQIQQIAERLAGLRDALEITPEEMAKVCNLTTEQYLLLESGTVDISVSVLHQISQAYGVELTNALYCLCPLPSSYGLDECHLNLTQPIPQAAARNSRIKSRYSNHVLEKAHRQRLANRYFVLKLNILGNDFFCFGVSSS